MPYAKLSLLCLNCDAKTCGTCRGLSLNQDDNYVGPAGSDRFMTVCLDGLPSAWNVLNRYNVWDMVTMEERDGQKHKWLRPLPERDYAPLAEKVERATFHKGHVEVSIYVMQAMGSACDDPVMNIHLRTGAFGTAIDRKFISDLLAQFG